MEKKIRVRFAPSPTGPLHMGGVRTALYNYLFAKKHNGTFILRIEDTDQNRFVEGAEEYIKKSLKWCRIIVEEGIEEGGEYGPYKQSERKPLYEQYAKQLIDSGNAYYAFDTSEELDALRIRLETEKANNTSYNSAVRLTMNNSLTLSKEETNKKLANGDAFVVRFKMPENELITFHDEIRKEVKVNTAILDDKVLFKSDGMPTYHLANIVDDYLMKISHVIRGEEWLPSLALHVMLYRALGWENEMPKFAHLPLLLKPTGSGKLSKRDGDKLGFPVFPLEWISPDGEISSGYKESGYFADSFINMLALLGWNPGTEQEILSMDELIQLFDLEKVGKSGSRFDLEKAKWFNQQYLRVKPDAEIADLFNNEVLKIKNIDADLTYTTKVCSLLKDRAVFIKDLWEQASFFYVAPTEFDEKVIKKKWNENTPELLTKIANLFSSLNNFSRETVETEFKSYLEKNEIGFGQVMNVLRLSLVGGANGPDIFDTISILGKQTVVDRIKYAVENIKK